MTSICIGLFIALLVCCYLLVKHVSRPQSESAPKTAPEPVFYEADFDIEHVDVIGIERRDDETIIGYISPKGGIQQWFTPCDLNKHADLVRRFRAKISS